MKMYVCLSALFLFSVSINAKELKLCGVEWPPFTYSEAGKITGGLTYDILSEAFNRLNIKVEKDVIPWARCLAYVETGKYDAVIDNAALDPFITGRHPTAKYTLGVYVRENYEQTDFSWSSLVGKSIGLVRGYDYTETITNYDGWIREYASTDELALGKLKVNRYDYVLLDTISADLLAKKVNIKIRMLKPEVDSTNLYLAFNKHNEDTLEAYDRVLGEMIQDGTMDSIYLKYLPKNYSALVENHAL
ncbi:substrate-binding periplasmic protein [Vibrio caribbeanicus]|uniref:substrate-binding periplasmic protein n=1 Tax=Vibrio caribbeanicus TaxID=701175 RepID=UPI0030DAA285